jgi:hypothetical protein
MKPPQPPASPRGRLAAKVRTGKFPAAWARAIQRGRAARNPYPKGGYLWILFEASAGRPILRRAP